MSKEIEKLTTKIRALQMERELVLKDKKFRAFSKEEHDVFCTQTTKLADLCYAAYLKLKENHPIPAIHYFSMAYDSSGSRNAPYDLVEARKIDAKATIDENRLPSEASTLYRQALSYQLGVGKPQNLGNAVLCLKKAAELKYPQAEGYLGLIYEHGKGVQQSKELSYQWDLKAAEQGYARAQCNLALICERNTDIPQAARWLRLSAEQGFVRAKNLLKDKAKNYPIMAIHLALLDKDLEQIKSLFRNIPYLVKELIWDINRSKNDIIPFNSVTSVIHSLLIKRRWPKRLNARYHRLTMVYLKAYFEQQAILDTEQKIEEFKKAVALIGRIKVTKLAPRQTIHLLSFIVDSWYQSYELNNQPIHSWLTDKVFILLKDIFFHLESLHKPLSDMHWHHQVALIFIKKVYGPSFEPCFTAPSFDQLLSLLSLYKMNPEISYEAMNKTIGMTLIKPVDSISPTNLLNQLSNYLQNSKECSKTSSLINLKGFLEERWMVLKDKTDRNARKILSDIINRSKQSLESNINDNTFFTIKDDIGIFIYNCLANENFKKLSLYLNEKTSKDNDVSKRSNCL